MYGRTRSETKRISAFVEKTKNDCVIFQIYHDTQICPKTHDFEELWQRDLFLKKGVFPIIWNNLKKKLWKIGELVN